MLRWIQIHTTCVMYSRDQWFWQNFIISMCGIKFWKGYENLRPVNKNRFWKYWAVSFIFDLTVLKKYSLSLLRDKNFFSSNMANGISQNSSFHTDFKNVHLIALKVHPKNCLPKKCFANWKIGQVPEKSFFWAKLFKCTLLKSV